MSKFMVRVIKNVGVNPLARDRRIYVASEEEAMETIRNLDKEHVTRITVWELKKEIDL